MALSQPHPPEGTRGEAEGLSPSIAESGAPIQSKVQTQRGERDAGPRGGPVISVRLINKQWIYIRALCPAHGLSLAGMERAPCCQAVTLLLGTVMGNNTIAFIVMSSIAESSTTGLKLPVLRIPQGQAKQISHTLVFHACLYPTWICCHSSCLYLTPFYLVLSLMPKCSFIVCINSN